MTPNTELPTAAKSAIIQLRARPETRDLLDRAAAAEGRTRTDFVLDAATRRAESVLLDRRHFTLPGTDYDAFVAALDAPPRENPRLRALLETPAPWDA